MCIVTRYNPPPIPPREFDLCAYIDGCEEEGAFGFGATEQEAVSDLLESYPEHLLEEAA